MSCQSGLSLTDFLSRTGLTQSEVNVDYINYLLSAISEMIQDEVGETFSLTLIDEDNPIKYRGLNKDMRKINCWQDDVNFKVVLGYYGEETPVTVDLVRNRDYFPLYYKDSTDPSFTRPIYAIRLIDYYYRFRTGYYWRNYGLSTIGLNRSTAPIYDLAFLEISGNRGFSDGFPTDLIDLIYEVVKEKNYYNQRQTDSSGSGAVTEEKDLTTSVKYGDVDVERTRGVAIDFLDDPRIKQSINKYKQYTLSIQSVIS